MSGSRGPLSNPNAIRRNLRPPKLKLPAEGYRGPIPDWPLYEYTGAELDRWKTLWRTPQAAAWIRMAIDTVVARYVRLSLTVESDTRNNVATAQTLSTVLQLEKELGLSPSALKRLEWEIVEDEVEEQRQAAPPSRGRRLRAVDPNAEATG